MERVVTYRMQVTESMRAEDGITIMEKRSVDHLLITVEGGITTDIELKMIVMIIAVGYTIIFLPFPFVFYFGYFCRKWPLHEIGQYNNSRIFIIPIDYIIDINFIFVIDCYLDLHTYSPWFISRLSLLKCEIKFKYLNPRPFERWSTNPKKVVGSNPTPVEAFGLQLLAPAWRNTYL